MKRIALTLIIGMSLALTGVSVFSEKVAAGNWPQWRGPDGSGISNEKNLPAVWTPTTNIKWKIPIAFVANRVGQQNISNDRH